MENMENIETNCAETAFEAPLDLYIEELEELSVPAKIICVCSSTCSCTTSSCVGWAGV